MTVDRVGCPLWLSTHGFLNSWRVLSVCVHILEIEFTFGLESQSYVPQVRPSSRINRLCFVPWISVLPRTPHVPCVEKLHFKCHPREEGHPTDRSFNWTDFMSCKEFPESPLKPEGELGVASQTLGSGLRDP